MIQYLNMLKKIMDDGEQKYIKRSDVTTLVVPPMFFQHDMRDGFPLVTTKQVAKKTMAVELEGFIKGITDKTWYQERGCKIWNEWCNPIWVDKNLTGEERKKAQAECNDLGPIYGERWANFGNQYLGRWGHETFANCRRTGNVFGDISVDGGYDTREKAMARGDQFAAMIHTLKDNPDDRRMVVNAWDINALPQQGLPACHLGFVIQHINGVLHLAWSQRSADFFLGIPFNIASYALLLRLIAQEVGMQAGTLSAMFVDCHLYENQYEQVKEQLTREPRNLPTVEITKWDGIYNWEYKDIKWHGYNPYPPLKADVVV